MADNPAYDSSRYGGLPIATTHMDEPCNWCGHANSEHTPGACENGWIFDRLDASYFAGPDACECVGFNPTFGADQ